MWRKSREQNINKVEISIKRKLKNTFEQAEERISELKDSTIEVIESVEQKE